MLLVVTDGQPAATARHMPKLQKLVGERGVSFGRAYLADPLCCSSRATILTGKYTNNHHRKGGARKFRAEGLHRDTIGTRLDGAGYATGYFGKWMNGYDGGYVPPGWDRWFAFSGDLTRPDSYDVNSGGRAETFPREHNETDLLRDEAADFVKGLRDEPWMAVVATHAPRGPYWPPERYEDRFGGVKLPRTPAFDKDDVSNKPDAYRRPPLSGGEKRKLRRAYEGKPEALQGVDDLVGGLIAALERTRQLENTYVVYPTDDGYLLGEHRHEAKGKPYEGSIKTPVGRRPRCTGRAGAAEVGRRDAGPFRPTGAHPLHARAADPRPAGDGDTGHPPLLFKYGASEPGTGFGPHLRILISAKLRSNPRVPQWTVHGELPPKRW